MPSEKVVSIQNLAWRAHLAEYVAEFRPESTPEHDLVFELAAAQWRIRRLLKTGANRDLTPLHELYDLALANLLEIQARRNPPDPPPARSVRLMPRLAA